MQTIPYSQCWMGRFTAWQTETVTRTHKRVHCLEAPGWVAAAVALISTWFHGGIG